MQILQGHYSPETAYVVEDYPYGFRLRCKIRYWLDFHQKRGVRFMSQTSNPKRGDIWNKPKASTYSYVAGAMYLDEKTGYVNFMGLSEYSELQDSLKFQELYGAGVLGINLKRLEDWINRKRIYEGKLGQGIDWHTAGKETVLEIAKAGGDSFLVIK